MSWKLKFWGLNFLLKLLQSFFVPLFRDVPLVLRWYSVGIMKCPACVLGNVQLFRHCSGVFRCSAGVLCLFALCSRAPGFIVCPKNIVSLLITFYMFSNNSVFIKVKLDPIFVSLNRISRELRCYNILPLLERIHLHSVTFLLLEHIRMGFSVVCTSIEAVILWRWN